MVRLVRYDGLKSRLVELAAHTTKNISRLTNNGGLKLHLMSWQNPTGQETTIFLLKDLFQKTINRGLQPHFHSFFVVASFRECRNQVGTLKTFKSCWLMQHLFILSYVMYVIHYV